MKLKRRVTFALGFAVIVSVTVSVFAYYQEVQERREKARFRQRQEEFAPGVYEGHPDILAAQFDSCPNGHSKLIDVPIHYGLGGVSAKERPKYIRSIEKLKFIQGGCVIHPRSPFSMVVCKICRFQYAKGPSGPSEDSWQLYSADRNLFGPGFVSRIPKFPFPEGSITFTQYRQHIARLECSSWESVRFTAVQSSETCKEWLSAWLNENGYEGHMDPEADYPGMAVLFVLEPGKDWVSVRVRRLPEELGCAMEVSFIRYGPGEKFLAPKKI